MTRQQPKPAQPIPIWALYGEDQAFPDVLHIERITDRAAGLDWHIAPHRHLHLHQFFLIRDGQSRITLDGAEPATIAPFLLSVPSGVVHGFTFQAGTEGFVLTIPLQTLPELLGPATGQSNALGLPAVLPTTPEVEALFFSLYNEYAATQPGRAMLLRALAMQLACLVLRSIGTGQPVTGPSADPRFVQFQAQLHLHLRDGWALREHADAIGISERHLSRLCRAATGQPAAALIEAALMREACRLLAYTRAAIASVGYDLGFDDPSYFSRAFRRVIGLSPRAYRAGFDRA